MNDVIKQPENSEPKPLTGFQLHPENINMNGRPPKGWAWAELIEDAVEEVVEMKGEDGQIKEKIEIKKAVIRKLVQLALKGDISAIKELFDRTEGKPLQRLAGADGGSIDVLLNKIERTNYDEVARRAREQMVEADKSLQDQGQTGGTDNIQAERHTDTPLVGEGASQVQPSTEG